VCCRSFPSPGAIWSRLSRARWALPELPEGHGLTTPDRSRLAEITGELGARHAAFETALGQALEHAFRAGELLIEAKALVPHGGWLRWLEENFAGSERTAQGYMQLASESDPRLVADLGVRGALAALAAPTTPATLDDGQPAEPGAPSAIDLLREEGGLELEHAGAELAQEDAHRNHFPRAGVERATWSQIQGSAKAAERALEVQRIRGLADWSYAEGLRTAAKHYRDARELALELAVFVQSRTR